jgi:hypothetical protein
MANTTNFGWETPDDTDLVKDGAAAIRTLGSAIDTSLVDLKGGTTGQVLSKTSNTDMDFTWVTSDDANAIQNAIVDAKGDLITATAADTPARLAVGTNGQVLTADSTTATGLKWAAPAGGGKVLQVVSTTKSDTFSSSSTSLTDITGMSVSITPTAATSKIYIEFTLSAAAVQGSVSFVGLLLRDSTPIARGDAAGSRTRVTTPTTREYDTAGMASAVGFFLDSPATTSAITYKLQGRGTGGTWYINTYGSDADNADSFRMISTITAWEIGA